MLFKSIMVPFDGSEPSARAYKTALQFAQDDADVVLHVVRIIPAEDIPLWLNETTSIMGSLQFHMFDAQQYQDITNNLVEKARAEVEQMVEGTQAEMGERLHVDIVLRQNVADAIAEYVEENNCHMVIMGSRGLGGVRGFLGSVSYGVLQRLEVPVMIVK